MNIIIKSPASSAAQTLNLKKKEKRAHPIRCPSILGMASGTSQREPRNGIFVSKLSSIQPSGPPGRVRVRENASEPKRKNLDDDHHDHKTGQAGSNKST